MIPKHKNPVTGDLINHLPVKKSKIIIAAVLMSVMAMLWVRVIFGAKTDKVVNTKPKIVSGKTQNIAEQPQPKVSYVKLPVVPGRNDVLTRDIFSPENWKAFDWDQSKDSDNVEIDSSEDDGRMMHEKNLREIAQNYTVDAISTDQQGQIQAFMIDDVVSVGSTLIVEHKGYSYEFIVLEIKTEEVVLGWKNCTVTLQMSQSK
jgi:hypothetical protein